jgi:hypothetical protein
MYEEHTFEALVLLADQVLDRHLHILERDIRSSGRPHPLAVHSPRAHASSGSLNEQNTDSIHAVLASSNGSGEVVAPDTVGDPLLLSVHNIMLAVVAKLGLASKISDITTSIWLRDGQTDALVTVQDSGQYPVHQGLLTELHEGRATNAESTNDVPDETTRSCARELVS